MNKITPDHTTLWIDKTLSQQAKQDKKNLNQTKKLIEMQKENGKPTSRTKNYIFEVPFVDRFKDKLFTFNKIGNMQKIYDTSQSPTIKASLIFSKSKTRKKSCIRSVFRVKRNIIDMKKVTESSRVSLQSKDTQRQTRSLDASKVATVFLKDNKYRYGLDCSEIKEEQIQQTIAKRPINFRKLYTPHELRKGKENSRRAIQFQSEETNSEGQKSEHYEKLFFKNPRTTQTPSEAGLTQRSENILPQLTGRPNQSRISKRLIINTHKRQSINTEQTQQLLPKLKIPKSKKNIPEEKQKLNTIR